MRRFEQRFRQSLSRLGGQTRYCACGYSPDDIFREGPATVDDPSVSCSSAGPCDAGRVLHPFTHKPVRSSTTCSPQKSAPHRTSSSILVSRNHRENDRPRPVALRSGRLEKRAINAEPGDQCNSCPHRFHLSRPGQRIIRRLLKL